MENLFILIVLGAACRLLYKQLSGNACDKCGRCGTKKRVLHGK